MSRTPLERHYEETEPDEAVSAETLVSIIEGRELPPETVARILAILEEDSERASEERQDVDS